MDRKIVKGWIENGEFDLLKSKPNEFYNNYDLIYRIIDMRHTLGFEHFKDEYFALIKHFVHRKLSSRHGMTRALECDDMKVSKLLCDNGYMTRRSPIYSVESIRMGVKMGWSFSDKCVGSILNVWNCDESDSDDVNVNKINRLKVLFSETYYLTKYPVTLERYLKWFDYKHSNETYEDCQCFVVDYVNIEDVNKEESVDKLFDNAYYLQRFKLIRKLEIMFPDVCCKRENIKIALKGWIPKNVWRDMNKLFDTFFGKNVLDESIVDLLLDSKEHICSDICEETADFLFQRNPDALLKQTKSRNLIDMVLNCRESRPAFAKKILDHSYNIYTKDEIAKYCGRCIWAEYMYKCSCGNENIFEFLEDAANENKDHLGPLSDKILERIYSVEDDFEWVDVEEYLESLLND